MAIPIKPEPAEEQQQDTCSPGDATCSSDPEKQQEQEPKQEQQE
jgi:hypothetical protein